jgi:integrase
MPPVRLHANPRARQCCAGRPAALDEGSQDGGVYKPANMREYEPGRRGADLAFGATRVSPFCPNALKYRADRAWKAAGLQRITPHECRHSFASIAIAAGVNIGTVSAALGHASVTITWSTYHHLLPGTMDQAADLIQAYVATAS